MLKLLVIKILTKIRIMRLNNYKIKANFYFKKMKN